MYGYGYGYGYGRHTLYGYRYGYSVAILFGDDFHPLRNVSFFRAASEQCSGVRKRVFVFGVLFGVWIRTGSVHMFGIGRVWF
jgi:hypothetical protein